MMRACALGPWLMFALSACQSTAQSSNSVDDKQSEAPPPPAAAAGSCGGKTQPDCPLQGWMKSTLQTYQREKDFGRLATALEKLAANAPPGGYANWKETALAGAIAAQQKDETAISKNCKSCHNEHRARFRKERRTEPLF